MEVALLVVFAIAVLAVGIRVGMLLAPRVERMADRANRLDPVADPAADATIEPAEPTESAREDADDRTD